MKKIVVVLVAITIGLLVLQPTLAQKSTGQESNGLKSQAQKPQAQKSQAQKSQAQKSQAQKSQAQMHPSLGDPVICIECGPCEDCDPCPGCPPDPPLCLSPNPIDDATFFVQQQYRDFLHRDPFGFELANDVAALNSCLLLGDLACYNTERVKMSRRMWDKPEFRQQSFTFGLPLVGDLPFEHYNNDDFIELEYLIYLQRFSSAPPDDFHRYGYFFWLGVLNNCVSNSGNFTDSSQCYNDSINAFLLSTEYRARFGCP